MKDPAAATIGLRRLSELGVRLAVDDFGTGYSSLAYLQQFPIDLLKIDGSFVSDILTPVGLARSSQAIVQIAHTLGLMPVAEGVESAAQAEALVGVRLRPRAGLPPRPPARRRRRPGPAASPVRRRRNRGTRAADARSARLRRLPESSGVAAQSIAACGDLRARERAFGRGCGRGSSTRRSSRCRSSSPVFWIAQRLDLIAATPIWLLCGAARRAVPR